MRCYFRGDSGYEDVRRALLWNARTPQRFPEVIVQPSSADDVAEAVGLARSKDLHVATRSGGHSWWGAPLRDRSLLVDLGGLDEIEVDPGEGRALVGPAAETGALVEELARHELAFPAGHCPTVALGGYVLAGGCGWNYGIWGPACHSLEALDLVSAAGTRLTASAESNADFLWAARGGGTAFPAIVTALRLRLHPSPRAILQSTHEYPLVDSLPLASWADRVVAHLSPMVEATFQLICPAPRHSSLLVSATAFASDRDGRDLLAPFEHPVANGASRHRPAESKTFSELYEGPLEAYPRRHRYAADHFWSNRSVGFLITHLAPLAEEMPSSKCHLLIYSPPQPDEPPPPGASFAQLGSTFVGCYAVWDDPHADEAHDEWIDQVRLALAPVASGHYIGEADLSLTSRRSSDCFEPPSWKRLQAFSADADPTGIFRSPRTA